MTKYLFELLEAGKIMVDEVCKNPTKENAKKLERLTQITQDEIRKQTKAYRRDNQ